MTTFLLLLIFGLLAVPLSEGNWRTGLLVTVAIGFLQDPIRKITPNQPSLLVGLVMVAFALCSMVLLDRRGRIDLPAMLWTTPQLGDWLPIFYGLIALQSVNSILRFGDPVLTAIGAIFYLAPLVGLWMGFHVGCNQQLLKQLILVYLAFCAFFAFTVFLDFLEFPNALFEEVGQGILITLEGYSAQGASGLWRTSEIASWHLAAAACLSATMALSSRESTAQIGFLLLAVTFTFISIFTGRRKAVALVLVFAAVYMLLFSRRANAASRERVILSVLGVVGLAYGTYVTFVNNALGPNFPAFLGRTLTIGEDVGERVQGQGIGGTLAGLRISQGFGLGVGAGTQTGNFQVGAARQSVEGLGFAAEGGGGRVVLEMGLPGLVVMGMMGFLVALMMWRNFRLLKLLPPPTAALMMGLVAFPIANISIFSSAGQLYNDPFVLIMLAICLGSFFAVPSLVALHQQQLLIQQQMAAQALQRRSLPLA
jgi:hypothetical protein